MFRLMFIDIFKVQEGIDHRFESKTFGMLAEDFNTFQTDFKSKKVCAKFSSSIIALSLIVENDSV